MNEEPTYYRVQLSLDLGEALEDINEDDAVHFLTDKEVDPYDAGDDWHAEWAVRASKEEHADWTRAYETFSANVKRAKEKLNAARDAWEQAQGVFRATLEDVWQGYAPTDAAITNRYEEVETMRLERDKEERAAEARAAQEAQDREDAELGPRTWVVFHPSSSEAKAAPDMMVPVIHLAGCKVTEGREDLPYSSSWKYTRPSEVEKVLLKGAPRCSRGMPTTEMLPTKLCGRCKPQESLRQALGEVYESWQEEQDNRREPMPTAKGLPGALKLQNEWGNYRTPGYSAMSDKYYRAEGLIEADELMVGWYVPEKDAIMPNEQALERLVKILPARGFIARRVKEPRAFSRDGKMSDSGVAVRRMTRAEIRQHKGK